MKKKRLIVALAATLAVWEVVEDGKLADHWLDSISRLPPDTGGPALAGLPVRPVGKFRQRRMR